MYNTKIGKKIQYLYSLVKNAKTEKTKNKHLSKINELLNELFN